MNDHHKYTNRGYRLLRRLRTLIQLVSFLIIPGLFISVFSSIRSLAGAAASGTFSLAGDLGTVLLLLVVFVVTLIWGRYFCGFFCAFGALQDFMWFLGEQISKKLPRLNSFRKKSSYAHWIEKNDGRLKTAKYLVLFFSIVGSVCAAVGWNSSLVSLTGEIVWSPWTVFGMYASPFRGFAPLKYLFSPGGALLLIILAGSLITERFFCRYLCPLGAVFAIISRFRITGIKKSADKCAGCRLCTAKCSMAVPLYKYDRVKSGECINCMKCAAVCPKENVGADTVQAAAGTLTAAVMAGAIFTGAFSEAGSFFQNMDSSTYDSVGITEGDTTAVGAQAAGTDAADTQNVDAKNNIAKTTNAKNTNVDTADAENTLAEIADAKNTLAETSDAENTNVETADGENTLAETSDAKNTDSETAGAAADETREDGALSDGTAVADGSLPEEAKAEKAGDSDGNQSGNYADGTYSGTAEGFRGETGVTVTIEDGEITGITVDFSDDDRQFLEKARDGIISSILSAQNTDVDIVSGASFSSKSILNAVEDALELIPARSAESLAEAEPETEAAKKEDSGSEREPETEAEKKADSGTESRPETGAAEQTDSGSESRPEVEAEKKTDSGSESRPEVEAEKKTDSGTESEADSQSPGENEEGIAGGIADGTYQGSGTGLKGSTNVSVEVRDGKIIGIDILSYSDDPEFFNRAESTMIGRILSSQSTEVDAVSGATFSSNSILEAVAEALGSDFSISDVPNTDNETSGKHGQKNGGGQQRFRKKKHAE